MYVLFRVTALEATSVKLFVGLFPDLRGSLSKSKNQNLVSQRDKIIEWELFDSYFTNCKNYKSSLFIRNDKTCKSN